MNDPKLKKQILDKLKDSNNVLVALNASPSVDELSAALGITLAVNKLDKHATAVFSGDIPAAIEFLEPEKTFENNVSSLQDFIIALDKEKADHLRYKVEGDLVKIFITPYRTTISQDDLDFSQGDFNVDFVIAVGVQSADDLDAALKSHGQILDGATVASINLDEASSIGTINWNDKNASSYCEMTASLVNDMGGKDLMDEQISTALLTGIVAATDRFSNAKTSSRVMTTAAELMGAGANQQLIAVQLQNADEISSDKGSKSSEAKAEEPVQADAQPAGAGARAGELSINHEFKGTLDEVAEQVAATNQGEAAQEAHEQLAEHLGVDQATVLGDAKAVDFEETPLKGAVANSQWQSTEEPVLGGTLNATTEQAADQKRRDEANAQNHTILSHDSGRYLGDQPSYQAPISAAVDTAAAEPEVRDIFADNPVSTLPQQAQVSTLPPLDTSVSTLPPLTTAVPAPSGPTLADIDANNRGHEAALGDVHAAFVNQPAGLSPGGGLPALPNMPLPPMPDFSTLPPLPGAPAVATEPNPFSTLPPSIPSAPLGNTLPPAPAEVKADPAQFQIPGQ